MGREGPNDVGGPEDRGLVRGHKQPGGERLGLSHRNRFQGKELAFHKKTLKSGLRDRFHRERSLRVSSTRGSFRGRGWALRQDKTPEEWSH